MNKELMRYISSQQQVRMALTIFHSHGQNNTYYNIFVQVNAEKPEKDKLMLYLKPQTFVLQKT